MSDIGEQGFEESVCCSQWCPNKDEHENLHGEIEFVARLAQKDSSVLQGAALGASRAGAQLSKEHGTVRDYSDQAVRHVRDAMRRAGVYVGD